MLREPNGLPAGLRGALRAPIAGCARARGALSRAFARRAQPARRRASPRGAALRRAARAARCGRARESRSGSGARASRTRHTGGREAILAGC